MIDPEQTCAEDAESPIEDFEGEALWDETLAKSLDLLEQLADKALDDYRAGRTTRIGTCRSQRGV